MVNLDSSDDAKRLGDFLDELHGDPGFQAVYLNTKRGAVDDATWSEFQGKLAV